jgi:hypothetical protein
MTLYELLFQNYVKAKTLKNFDKVAAEFDDKTGNV